MLYCNKDIKGFHGEIYDRFVEDYRYNKYYPFVNFPAEYDGQNVLKLCPSQHADIVSSYQKKKISQEWANYLLSNPLPIQIVQVCTALNQEVFDALCSQTSIESLRIKWFRGKNIEAITKLKNLKKLFIESAPSLLDISPIAKLTDIEVLILGNTKKITDYCPLGELSKVKVFSICSYRTHETILKMADDNFMYNMKALRYVDMVDVRVDKREFLKPENLEDMDFAAYYFNKEEDI